MENQAIAPKEFKNSSGDVYCTVKIYPASKMIHDIWQGQFRSPENFRAVINHIVEQVVELKLDKWLADLRGMQGVFDSSSTWVQEQVIFLTKQGLKKEAVIIPTNSFAKLSTRDTSKTIIKTDTFELKQFEDYTEAQNWLRGIEK